MATSSRVESRRSKETITIAVKTTSTRSHSRSVRSGSSDQTGLPASPCSQDTATICELGRNLLRPGGPENHPTVIVAELTESLEGCHWLRDRWIQLNQILATGRSWTRADQAMFVALLGREPIEAHNDPKLNEIFLAWDAIEQGSGRAYWESCRERAIREGCWTAEQVTWREIAPRRPRDRAHALTILTSVVHGEIEKLEALEAGFETISRRLKTRRSKPFSIGRKPLMC